MEKYNEIQLTKNKMGFNNRNMKNHPPSPHEEIFNQIIYCCVK